VIVPEVKDGQATGITLLHVRFADRLPVATARGVLQGYRNRYAVLRDAVQETEPTFREDLLADIPVELTVELGRTRIPIHELLRLQPGSTVKLARLEGEPVDILANDVLVARGEVVVRNEKYGIRITEITSRADRLKGLK